MKLLPRKKLKNIRAEFIIFLLIALLLHLVFIYFFSFLNGWKKGGKEYDRIKIVDFNDVPELRMNRGDEYLQRGMPDRALSEFKTVLEQNPDSRRALEKAGWILLLDNRPEESLEYLNRLIKIDPDKSKNYMMRAGAYVLKQDYERAIADYEKAGRLSPEDPDVFFGLGRTCLLKKDFKKAEYYFNLAVDKNPGQPVYLLSRSFACINQGKFEPARYDAARILNSKNVDPDTKIGAYLALAEIEAVGNKDYKEARRYYGKVLELQKEREKQNIEKKPETGFQRLFDFGYDHWENPHMGVGVGLMDSGSYAEALSEFEKALKDPVNPKTMAYLYMALTYHWMGKNEKARDMAEKWFSSGRPDVKHYHEDELACDEAVAYMILGNYDRALEKINYALEFNSEYYYQRGLIYMKKGDHDDALRDFKAFVRENPELEEVEEARKYIKEISR